MKRREFIKGGKAVGEPCTVGSRVEVSFAFEGQPKTVGARLVSQTASDVRFFRNGDELTLKVADIRSAVEIDAAAWDAKGGHRDGTKTERINLRVTSADRMALERAAARRGESLSQFIARVAVDAARSNR